MSDNPLILVVDDDPINLEIMEEILEKNYQLAFAETGEQCIEKLEKLQPNLILLDVNMPGMGGIKTCKAIKDNFETDSIPIIFVSALSLPDERIIGYKAGADDYLTKPFKEEELLIKIELTLTSVQEKLSLQQGANDSMSMAMTAMTQASEMGEVMQFNRDSFHCNTAEALAKRLLESLSQFELRATIRITSNKQDSFFSSSGNVGDREEQIMEHVREGERFIHFGKRTFINFKNISVLIKNMPIDDEAKYGRLNDVTGMLVEGADARLMGIDMSSSLLKLIKTTREVLNEIEVSRNKNKNQNTAILTDLTEQIEWSFIHMDLSEQQEDFFRSQLNIVQDKTNALFDSDHDVDKKLDHLINSLSIPSEF